jgi:hypothetical protein
MSDLETLKAALETSPYWEAVTDGNKALERLLSSARAEGYAEAKEQAASIAFDGSCDRCGKAMVFEQGSWWHAPPFDNQSDHFAGPGMNRRSIAGRIRAMEPKR